MIEISAYPKKTSLRDGTSVILRPMTRDDEAAVLSFFLGVPEDERWYLKEDVSSPRVIHQWSEGLDYKRALPLLALSEDGRVIANAVLVRRRGGSRGHVADVRVVVATEYRGRGLGVSMIRELCDIADDAGLDKVIAEMVVGKEDEAIRAFESIGFYKLATLEGMAKDPEGRAHDLVVMVMPLGKYYEWSKF